MSFSIKKDTVEDGDTVIIYLSINNIYTFDIKKGKVFQSKYGALKHDDLIGKKYGSVIHGSRGWVHVLQPTPELWTITLPHRTQILYTPDISTIIMGLDLKPGKVVCESGTGSGSLSHALIRTVAPTGHLYTFDFHEQRVEIAREEFRKHGLSSWVTVQHRDVLIDGFGLDQVVDAVFLDLPKPWVTIASAKRALCLQGGRLCSFSPCIEQVQRTCQSLSEQGFSDVTTMEVMNRQLELRNISMPRIANQDLTVQRRNSAKIVPVIKTAKTALGHVTADVKDEGATVDRSSEGATVDKSSEGATIDKSSEGATIDKSSEGATVNTSITDEPGGTFNNGCSLKPENIPASLNESMDSNQQPTTGSVSSEDCLSSKDSRKRKQTFQSHPSAQQGKREEVKVLTAIAPLQVTGHTGYLTFATLYPWRRNTGTANVGHGPGQESMDVA